MQPAAEKAQGRWFILCIVYLAMLGVAITLQAVPPLLGSIVSELKVSFANAGLLMSLFALPGVFISIPAGALADRYGERLIGSISFLLMIGGQALFTTGHTMVILGAARIVSGVGAMTLMVLLPQILSQRFAGAEIGLAMGIFNTAIPLGTILSLNVLSVIDSTSGWRLSSLAALLIPLAAFLLFMFFFSSLPRRASGGEKARSMLAGREDLLRQIARSGWRIWLVGACWLLFNASIISLFTFTPTFLVGLGFSPKRAGATTSAVMWLPLVLSPATGLLIDRIGGKRTMIASAGVALAVLIALVPGAAHWMQTLMLLIGVAQTLVPSPVMALAPDVVPKERLGVGFGIISTCFNLGILIGPALLGWARDVTGSFSLSYALMALLSLLIAFVVIGLRPHRIR
ncbi:MAG: MFS transporter [Spirochaetia bacterium]|jgi:MFS family permease